MTLAQFEPNDFGIANHMKIISIINHGDDKTLQFNCIKSNIWFSSMN